MFSRLQESEIFSPGGGLFYETDQDARRLA